MPITTAPPEAPAAMPDALPMEEFSDLWRAARQRLAEGENPLPFARDLDLTEDGLGLTDTRDLSAFGVEIELDGARTNSLARALYQAGFIPQDTLEGYHASSGQYHRWRYESDSSCGTEIVSPILYGSPADWDALESIMLLAVTHNGQATARCGFHVHCGTGRWRGQPGHYAGLFDLAARHSDILYRLGSAHWPPHQPNHRGHSYCRPIAPLAGVTISAMEEVRSYSIVGHYGAVNATQVRGRHTDHVEFRFCDGSNNLPIMQAQIILCLLLCRAAQTHSMRVIERLANCPAGHHLRMNPRERRLGGAAWARQTQQLRQFIGLLAPEPELRALLVALFALTRWQPAIDGSRLAPARKPSAEDRARLEREQNVTVQWGYDALQHETAYDAPLATQIADLVSACNVAEGRLSVGQIRDYRRDWYLARDGNGDLAGAVQARRADPYTTHIARLCVESGRDDGIAGMLLDRAIEAAHERETPLILTTVASGDAPRRALLRSRGLVCVESVVRSPHLDQVWARGTGTWSVLPMTPRARAVPGDATGDGRYWRNGDIGTSGRDRLLHLLGLAAQETARLRGIHANGEWRSGLAYHETAWFADTIVAATGTIADIERLLTEDGAVTRPSIHAYIPTSNEALALTLRQLGFVAVLRTGEDDEARDLWVRPTG